MLPWQLLSQQGIVEILRPNVLIDLNDNTSKSVGKANLLEVVCVVFDQIITSSICHAALCTKGAVGPSRINAHGWRRLCTSFKAEMGIICQPFPPTTLMRLPKKIGSGMPTVS